MTISTYQQLLTSLSKFSHQTALTCLSSGETLTYEELQDKVDRLIGYLSSQGIGVKTKVATIIPNSIESVLFGLAVSRCGATLVPLNYRLGNREVAFILQDAEPTIVITASKKHHDTICAYKSDNDDVVVIGLPNIETNEFPSHFKMFNWDEAEKTAVEVEVAAPTDLARIAYTGGTTGTPKGVMHTQEALVAEMEAACIEYPYDDADKVLFCTPIVHAAGVLMNRSLLTGCHIYIDRAFHPSSFLQTVQEERITSVFVVPTIIYRLIDEAKHQSYDVSSLRNMNYGSSPISTERLKEAFDIFGPILRQQYGMTECSILITRLTKTDHIRALENEPSMLKSCGKPCFHTEIKLVDENGNSDATVRRGEIVVKSPCVASGYYKQEALTNESFRDGWFYTGDIGELDDEDYLYIVERKKDMIISGGFNVYSVEVEGLVNQHPAVAMSACIGVPDDLWGEAVCVFVVTREGETCTKEDVIEFCKARTSAYMVPKEVIFKSGFPLTTVGKIDKKELKKPFWENEARKVH